MLKEPHALIWDHRLSEGDKDFVEKLSTTMRDLSQRRAIEMTRSQKFARSKIAWLLTYYQQVLLHRMVALVDGTAATWNCRCTLTAQLSARAFMETFALFADFRANVKKHLAADDLAALGALARDGIYANRDKELLKERPETKAINVLTLIQRFDKMAQGFEAHYDALSERCHPNCAGHTYMFAELDRSDATVRFEDERNPAQNGFLIMGALATLPLVPRFMSELDKMIEQVAELQHRVRPVGGEGE